jgi:hypothetical protein
VVFLVAAVVLLLMVAERFLLPALRVSMGIDATGRRHLGVLAMLVLAVVLVVLVLIWILAFRPGRFFIPRPWQPRTRTGYVDAWAESGRRMETPPEEEEEGDGGSKFKV